MNRYETVFIATPVLSDGQLKELVGKFQGVITENGGKVTPSEEWGLKKLAYPIQKKNTRRSELEGKTTWHIKKA